MCLSGPITLVVFISFFFNSIASLTSGSGCISNGSSSSTSDKEKVKPHTVTKLDFRVHSGKAMFCLI